MSKSIDSGGSWYIPHFRYRFRFWPEVEHLLTVDLVNECRPAMQDKALLLMLMVLCWL